MRGSDRSVQIAGLWLVVEMKPQNPMNIVSVEGGPCTLLCTSNSSCLAEKSQSSENKILYF